MSLRRRQPNQSQLDELSLKLAREYGIAKSTISVWNRQYKQACYSQAHNKNSGSFRKRDNLTDEEKELISLRKENKYLKMENDILKQAALILGRKGK